MVFSASVLLIDGVGWKGGRVKGYPWSSHEAHTMVHATLVDHGGTGSNPRFPPPNWCPPLVPLFQS